MMRKKFSCICFVMVMAALFLAGCGRKEASDTSGAPIETTESETAASRMEKAMIQEEASETSEEEEAEEVGEAGPGAMESSQNQDPDTKVEAFAEKVQEAVSDRNLEALADLIFYPCVFITGDQEKIILQNREDLTKQNPDMVFGDDLMVAVANVDTGTLQVAQKRVVLGEGESYITFQVKNDGTIGIIEIKE
ncbi:lipoprotein [Lacrimispora sp.]|uniref:LptM family lipoprotein n=1 Tax=Lacrimispora sp. TaxID=2719234 RepID=UPI003996BB37